MKVREILQRAGFKKTGLGIAYIKDALEDMNTISETHVSTVKMDIIEGQRFYKIPKEAVKILDIRCKDHRNEDSQYRSIPRTVYKPLIVDTDGK